MRRRRRNLCHGHGRTPFWFRVAPYDNSPRRNGQGRVSQVGRPAANEPIPTGPPQARLRGSVGRRGGATSHAIGEAPALGVEAIQRNGEGEREQPSRARASNARARTRSRRFLKSTRLLTITACGVPSEVGSVRPHQGGDPRGPARRGPIRRRWVSPSGAPATRMPAQGLPGAHGGRNGRMTNTRRSAWHEAGRGARGCAAPLLHAGRVGGGRTSTSRTAGDRTCAFPSTAPTLATSPRRPVTATNLRTGRRRRAVGRLTACRSQARGEVSVPFADSASSPISSAARTCPPALAHRAPGRCRRGHPPSCHGPTGNPTAPRRCRARP